MADIIVFDSLYGEFNGFGSVFLSGESKYMSNSPFKCVFDSAAKQVKLFCCFPKGIVDRKS